MIKFRFPTDLIKRDLFFFTCDKCKKVKRQSFFKERAVKKLCGICRRITISPGQKSLLKEGGEND